jgi:hypothetical protein
MYSRFFMLWTLSIAAGAPLAWAQPAGNGSKADPQDAKAPVPRVMYQSSLADYRAFSDEKLMPWKESNDNVGRIGGWRAYAKEAQEPSGASMPPGAKRSVPADSAKPMQGRMGGQEKK